jgi:hypothetical protein
MASLLARAAIVAATKSTDGKSSAYYPTEQVKLTTRAITDDDSPYGYTPHRYVAIIFIVLFGLSTRSFIAFDPLPMIPVC